MANFETQLLLNLNELEFDTSQELTVEEIKSRYKKLSLHYHPDLNNNEIFRDKQKKINSAKEFLLDNLDEINRYIRRINHKETDEDKARTDKEQWQRDEQARRAYYEQQARQKQASAQAEEEKAKAEQKAREAERAAEAARAQAAAAEARAREAESARLEAENKRRTIKIAIITAVILLIGPPLIVGSIMSFINAANEANNKESNSTEIEETLPAEEAVTMKISETNLPKSVIKGAKINWGDYFVTYKDDSGKDVKIALTADMISIDYENFKEQEAEIKATVDGKNILLYHKLTVISSTSITSIDALKSIANDPKGTYLLDADIDLGGAEWTPISSFEGKLMGNGHTIKNLTVTSFTTKNVGLFDTVKEKAEISDLKLENVSIVSSSTAESIGALAGLLNGKVTNVSVTGKIESAGSTAVGGIAGATTSLDSTLTNCSFNGSILGGKGVGGILGGNESNGDAIIDGCSVTGSVSGLSSVGGIVGSLASPGDGKIFKVNNCKNNATVSSKTDYCGGIVGKIENSTSWGPQETVITNCENNGAVSGSNYTSGIIGYMHIGGGYGGGATINNHANRANVTGKSYTGGIIGFSDFDAEITASENTGAISGEAYVGGFLGYGNYTILNNLTNEQSVSGSYYVGGIAGYAKRCASCNNKGNISANLFDTERNISGVGGIAGIADEAEGCTNSGEITAKTGYGIGGIVGANATSSYDGKYINCKNSGKITVSESIARGVGGIIGVFDQTGLRSHTLSISGCESAGAITVSNGDSIGGIIGYLRTTDRISIISCTSTAGITADNCTQIGGILGTNANSSGRYSAKIEIVTVKGSIIGKSTVGSIIGKTAKAPENYETVKSTYTIENNNELSHIGMIG